jgi:hypothetical protein
MRAYTINAIWRSKIGKHKTKSFIIFAVINTATSWTIHILYFGCKGKKKAQQDHTNTGTKTNLNKTVTK